MVANNQVTVAQKVASRQYQILGCQRLPNVAISALFRPRLATGQMQQKVGQIRSGENASPTILP